MNEFSLVFLKKCEIIKPDNKKIDKEIRDVYLDCGNNYFHLFNCDYVCDIELAKIKNEKKVKKQIRSDYDCEI